MTFLRNAWYPAGWSDEIAEKPLGRSLLNEPVLLFRAEDGEPVAMSDRCPHRFAPLHLGRVCGSAIECGYHGLVFDRNGHCIANPHGDRSVPKVQLKTYPVVDRGGVLWIWMGDPSRASVDDIIDTEFMVSPDFKPVAGYLLVDANYRLIIDNLMDLTHASYIHRGGLSSEEYGGDNLHHRFHQNGISVHSDYDFRNVPPSPQLKPFFPRDRTDVRAYMHLTAPSSLYLDFRMSEVNGDPEQGVRLPSLHLLCPATDNSTHYFYAIARNVALDDPDADEAIRQTTRQAFMEEDEPMIRACSSMMGGADLLEMKPVILKTDVAAVRARMLLDKLIRAENNMIEAA
ncbi:Rieske 2Fe-2S domain-containing protein [Sphingobium lactosutens]|uniref:Rieske domain-containing protein n=1 Tax=Sphingobium lactosutens DS20 TaxID=1331060 RepID=T0HAQ2_9SPHN|nr:Rieske 2Fe-2S domain-containing protein [Sphingobium lactosutens]EQB13391.1 hypothetical protein RLDS_16795 [Sphingobium lactosutens DS20]